MSLKFKLAVDRIVQHKAYPALATWSAEPYTEQWRQFVQHWPNTVPIELLEHCRTHSVECELVDVARATNAYYPVGIGFFNFDVDYFALMTPQVRHKLSQAQLTVLFYYHEGDNPFRIKERLDQLCQNHLLPVNCYRFVSGNTAADTIPGFAYFPDHELLYWHRNQGHAPAQWHNQPRDNEFTALSRTHKWWRATVMTDMHRAGILKNSIWSYGKVTIHDRPEDNPIEIDQFDLLRPFVNAFLEQGPFVCDPMTSDEQNNHQLTVYDHYVNSYCNIVLETHFDADQSGGAFLTEKTFKPIKHAQPFVIVGAPGSLAALRQLGYRTFDHVIDNSYDLELDNTQRWIKTKSAIKQIQQQDMHLWYEQCREDIVHNQQLFCASKHTRLNNLLERLQND